MSRRCRLGVDQIRMMFLIPSMELEDQLTIAKKPVILIAMFVFWQGITSEQDLPDTNGCLLLRCARR